MKKLILITVSALLLSLSALASDIILISPAPVNDIRIATPVVDGVIDPEYSKSYKLMVTGENDIFHTGKEGSDELTLKDSAIAYFLHDDSSLYVCVVVTDEKVYSRGEEWIEKNLPALSWENDAVEVRVYYEELGRPVQANQYIFQVDALGIATTNYLGMCEEPYKVSTALTDTGYICEFALPLSFGKKAGDSIGLAIEIDDLNEEETDPESKVGGHLFSAYGSQHPYRNMVVLSDKKANVGKVVFEDIEKHWGKNYVQYVIDSGLFEESESKFTPDKKITRAEFASILARAYEKKTGALAISDNKKFTDVDYESWYSKYIIWATDKGIINGKSETLFDPEADVTREEMALMLTRLAKLMGLNTEASSVTFPDKDKIAKDALTSVAFCQKAGYINGKENGFDPKGNATRAEVSTIIYRFMTSLTVK